KQARIRVDRGLVEYRRPNECPRCGFTYTAFNRPRENSTYAERFVRSLREQGQYGGGPFAKVRYAEAVHMRPWQCRCGTWLRAGRWRFGWVDVAGIAVLGVMSAFVSAWFPWARNRWVFAAPIALWVGYRLSTQVTVVEVPAPAERDSMGGRAAERG